MIVEPERSTRRPETGGLVVGSSDHPGGVVVVHAVGEVDLSTSTTLVTGIDDALDTKPAGLVIDLSEVGFFGSVGISALIEANRRTTCGTGLQIVATPMIRRVLGIVGLSDGLSLHDNLVHAVAAAT
ncbi:STAS domain-containing protein [Actinokineospora sp. HUAS TT18]|uniref:STAS domain-containing protein n=1 Tax=Actinokineospora sp. HUAS TT18 TaxID=3447451 RepID=UPI003F522148